MPSAVVEVIWQEGDAWRDLAAELRAATEVTAVSRSGTARLLRWSDSPPGAWHTRIPLEGGHRMWADERWGRLDVLRATPCGLYVEEPDHAWQAGTPLRLVLRGLHPRWALLPVARPVVERILARVPPPAAAGHPDSPCGAFYCLLRSVQ